MFRWCCYCQSFMGESEPRNDFSLTHGICTQCLAKIKSKQKSDIKLIAPIKSFFDDLQKYTFEMRKINKDEVIFKAKELNIKASDLLAGVMQPLLYEIGKLYTEGKITVVQEHRFSQFVNDLIYAIKNDLIKDDEKTLKQKNVDVFLSCVDGNYHEFGVSFIELFLRQAGISVEAVTPSLPADQLVEYAQSINAKVIGLSVSIEGQIKMVRAIMKSLKQQKDYQPRVIVGGYGVRDSPPEIDGVIFFGGSVEELLTLIRKYL